MKGEPQEHVSLDKLRRDKGHAFDEFRVETYCKARAKGGSVASAGTAAGVTKPTALKWEQHPEVRARTRELREGAEDFIGVSTAWCIAQLKRNAEEARDQGAFKASNEAILFCYKLMREDKNAAHNTATKQLPATLEGMQLQRALRESFSQPEREVIDVVAVPPPDELPPEDE